MMLQSFKVFEKRLKSKKLDCALSDDAASTGSAWPFGSKSGYLPYWAVLTSVFSHYGLDNKNFPPINQNLIPRSAITDLLTSQNAKRSVETKKKRKNKKQDKHLLNVIDARELISSLLVGKMGEVLLLSQRFY